MNKQCKICGEETREIMNEKLGVVFYYYDACEFISKDAEIKLTREEELALYETHENSIDDPTYVAYFKKFLNAAVLDYCTLPGKGLDFGSGPSPVLGMILERDYDFLMDIYDLYYSPEKTYEHKKYDLVTATEVVEHLKYPLEYFKLFESLLKDDGILSIMTLFHARDDAAFENWHYLRDITHISFYTQKTLESIAKMVGLEIIYTNEKRYTTFRKRK